MPLAIAGRGGVSIAFPDSTMAQAASAGQSDESPTLVTKLTSRPLEDFAAIMGMNNVYYRFLHLTSNEKYRTMRAGLRMNVMRTHGIDPLDFELWGVAVSAINNCQTCVDSHEKTLREKGVSEEKKLAAVRIAAVLNAIAVVLDAETAGMRELVAV